ncbi:ice-structuring glycoprotein-like, partial [Phymastichus coffea]|uniref:ice-structuring glycoprotein-like n=1 Tax=Phymastichus coffea TaxID=108790 RepID=UPI00273ABCA2
VPPGYVYQSPYLATTAPGGLVPLPTTPLSHAAAVAAASQFYEYQNAAAAAATYPAASYNFAAEAYPYTTAAAAGMLGPKVAAKAPEQPAASPQPPQNGALLMQHRLAAEKAGLLPQFLLRGNANAAAAASYVAPYTYTISGAGGLPTAATAAGAFPGLPYQATPQEARLQ